MLSTVLPVWGVTMLLSICCWSIGARLVQSKSPLVAMLCGWCVFLLVCCVPWVAGLSAHAVRPLLWLFFAVGLWLAIKGRRWQDWVSAAVCTAAITAILGIPYFRIPGLLAYGVHGLDMWGYVITGDWLQAHSVRELPVVGVSAMRFNWVWHVLTVRERPLNYESLACISASTGLTVVKAYLAYPIVLLASLAMSLAREPWIFRFKYWVLALPFVIVAVFHPLIVEPWIAGFFGGSIAGGFVAMAFAGAAVAEEGQARVEAIALAALMMVLCAGLYTQQFLYVAVAIAGTPVLFAAIVMALRHDFSPVWRIRISRLTQGMIAAMVMLILAIFLMGKDQPVNTGISQDLHTAAGHFLGIFGGSSPYVWLGYDHSRAFDRDPLSNPVGSVALVLMVILFSSVAWRRWKENHDLQVPILVVLSVGLLSQAWDDEFIMAKALAVFGFALVIMLAAVSSKLRNWGFGLVAAAVCCCPAVRSAAQIKEILYGPYIIATEENIHQVIDGADWMTLAHMHYLEDKEAFEWAKYPRSFSSMTHFLPIESRILLREKYHMPPQK